MTLAKTEDREEMNSGLVTFAVLNRRIVWASGSAISFSQPSSWRLSLEQLSLGRLSFLLLRRRLAAFNSVVCHFEFSFLWRLYLVQNQRTLASDQS